MQLPALQAIGDVIVSVCMSFCYCI